MILFSVIASCALPIVSAMSMLKESGAPTPSSVPSSRIFHGLEFNKKTYPNMTELSQLSLKELVDFRPSRLYGFEREHFFQLFALHAEVAALDLRYMSLPSFIQGWVRLWLRSNLGPASKKLSNTIKEYLDRDQSVTDEIKKMIVKAHGKMRNTIMQQKVRARRRFSTEPQEMEMRRKVLQRQTQYNNERKKYTIEEWRQIGAEEYRKMLQENNIPINLPSIQLEERSRHLKSILGGTHHTTMTFRNFILCRNDPREDEEMIDLAYQRRKEYNKNMNVADYNARRAEVRRRVKKQQEAIKDRQAESNGQSSEQLLTRQSRWWSAM